MNGLRLTFLCWGKEAEARRVASVIARAKLPAALVAGPVGPCEGSPEVLARAINRFLLDPASPCLCVVGGCGYGVDESVPDITAAAVSRKVPGIPEMIRQAITDDPESILFRGVAGLTAEGKLLVDLPGHPKHLFAALRGLAPVLVHALEKAGGDQRDCGPAPAAP